MLAKWLGVIAEHYPQHGDVTELAVIGYVEGLRDLSAQEMSLGFSRALTTCKFRPTAADVIEGLKTHRATISAVPVSEETKTCKACEGTGYRIIERDGYKYAQKCNHAA